MELTALMVIGTLCGSAVAQILSVPEACIGITCLNDGVGKSDDESGCYCACAENFTGLMCETEFHLSDWPNGPYATPMSIYGCPESSGHGWRTGYVNMTFLLASSLDSGNSSIDISGFLELLGPVSSQVMQMNFCFKLQAEQLPNEGGVKWPDGNYAIYRAGGSCPHGFRTDVVTSELPPLIRTEIDGFVPDLEIAEEEMTEKSVLTINVCLRIDTGDSAWNNWTSPFILLKGKADENEVEPCPNFPLFDVLEETSPIGWRYCSYRRDRKQDEEYLDVLEPFQVPDHNRNRKLAIKTELVSLLALYLKFLGYGYDLDSFLRTRLIDKPWWLIDLEQSVKLESIIINSPSALSFNWTYGKAPVIEVSDYRWAFVTTSGLRCDGHMTVNTLGYFLQPCHHTVRYVAITMSDWRRHKEQYTAFFHQSLKIDVIGTGVGCGKELGMRDGGIRDFQITASSGNTPYFARPHLAGWCAFADGWDAYLQVDLLVATVVEEVIIYNWERTFLPTSSNLYEPELRRAGTTHFRLEYGFSVRKLRNYTYGWHGENKTFNMDLSLPYNQPQTFRLKGPVLATIIRIYPKDTYEPCLKIELVGCRKHRLTTLQCEDNPVVWWNKQDEIFVSQASYHAPTVIGNVRDSDAECWELCESHFPHDCTAVKREGSLCSIYNLSNMANFRRMRATNVSSLASFSQRTCIDEPSVIGLETSSQYQRAEIRNMPLNTSKLPRSITSYGYPWPCDSGFTDTWTIDFDGKGYIELMFTNISLNPLPDVRGPLYPYYCEERIELRSNNLDNSLYETTTIAAARSKMNGKQLIYSTPHFVLKLLFQACALEEGYTAVAGRGFRAILNMSAIPACRSTPFMKSDSCLTETNAVTLSSDSFSYSGASENEDEFWYLDGYDKYLVLTFTDFDIVCEGGSVLEITLKHAHILHYCNLQRPVGDIVAREGSMAVRYSRYRYQQEQSEGFRANVKAVKLNKYIENIDITYPGNNMTDVSEEKGWQDEVKSFDACATKFGKCYRFYGPHPNIESHAPAWSAVNCSDLFSPEAQLVTIRSKAENDFIIYQFQQKRIFQGIALANRSLLFYTYIGLERDDDMRRDIREQWIDGSPVTYTSWAPNQPEDVREKKCTMMAINSLYDTHTWRTIECDGQTASFFVCEVRNKEIIEDNLYKQVVQDSDSEVGFGYFTCLSGEMISAFYVCDNVRDCLDGSDEIDCLALGDLEVCPSTYFRCSSGECVHLSNCCDFKPDCPDQSDEECDFPSCRGPDEFQCDNKQCIPRSSRCDFKVDCYDVSDEMYCDCQATATAFKCDDNECIHRRLQCDGFVDCTNSEDEHCEPSNPLSCANWWNAGFRSSGTYPIDSDDYIECNFEKIKAGEAVIETKYHNIGTELVRDQNGYGKILLLTYKSLKSVKELISGITTCRQSVIQTCRPPSDRITDIDNAEGHTDFIPCHCVRTLLDGTVKFSNTLEPCSNITRKETAKRGVDWLRDVVTVAIQDYTMPITKMSFHGSTNLTHLRFKSEPLVCQEVFENKRDELLCARGNAVDAERKCLFEYDEYKYIDGCRDLTHLQDCEDFDCPSGFVKCPGSFCLSISLLCDGVRQCPDGQDELNCWCGQMPTKSRFVILFNDESGLEETAVTIASQLYQRGNNIDSPAIELIKYDLYRGPGCLVRQAAYNPKSINQVFTVRYEQIPLNTLVSQLHLDQILESEETVSTSLILLQYDPFSLKELMSFNHSFVEHVQLFVLTTERSDSVLETENRILLPANAKYQAIKDWAFVSPSLLEIFSSICPEPAFPVCRGLYRCHASRICLPLTAICDGKTQCPYGDDEKYCNLSCPMKCSCEGYTIDCSDGRFNRDTPGDIQTSTRSLDLNWNNISSIEELNTKASKLYFLVKLNMSHCNLTAVPAPFLRSMINLLYLDLSFNQIMKLNTSDFETNYRLVLLDISGNYELLSISSFAFNNLIYLKSFAITDTRIKTLNADTFSGLRLTSLDLSRNEIKTIDQHAFRNLRVERLSLEGNPISHFSSNIFEGITSLRDLRTSSFKLCCLDHLSKVACFPKPDEFSSCNDLMRNDALRFLLWIIGISALVGNILSVLYRLKFDRKRLRRGYGIFVTNLAVSDFLMGVYLVIIAVADTSYRGQYILHDDYWRQSTWCSFAGVISTVSSEASIMFMCLITIDRILVIKYPFGGIRFKTKSAMGTAASVWVIVVVLATIPLWFTSYFKEQFYSRSAVCLALPLTRDRPPGWAYSMSLFVGFNLLTFLLIATGQWMIYREVHASSRKTGRNANRKQDLTVARNLLLVVSTDFLCWFPIGVMGIMAFCGYVIPGEVYAWSAVLLLPVNSALNPFLYTFSVIIAKKSFMPSVEEQSRTQAFSKDVFHKITDIWNSNLVLQRVEDDLTYLPLVDYIGEERLPVKVILQISILITKALGRLHSVDLVHGDLRFEDIYVAKKNNTMKASIKGSPKFLSRQAETKKDIDQLGGIIMQLCRYSTNTDSNE